MDVCNAIHDYHFILLLTHSTLHNTTDGRSGRDDDAFMNDEDRQVIINTYSSQSDVGVIIKMLSPLQLGYICNRYELNLLAELLKPGYQQSWSKASKNSMKVTDRDFLFPAGTVAEVISKWKRGELFSYENRPFNLSFEEIFRDELLDDREDENKVSHFT